MSGRGWSVYIHFPYCLRRCAYCDFATSVARDIPREAYLDAILHELELRTRDLEPATIDTVFFGGGTPSLWGPGPVAAVLQWLDAWGGMAADAELSLEANPGAAQAGVLGEYTAAGINRLSVGIQALSDDRLRALDRVHDAAAARVTLAEIGALLARGSLRSASADLLFGAPGQSMADLRQDVRGVLDAGLPHLSAYSLTVEPGTPLHGRVERRIQAPPDEGLQAEMLAALPDLVVPFGLSRYEVSNYAKPAHRCLHNLAYWNGSFYLSAGVGAHGFLPSPGPGLVGRRYGNTRSPETYLRSLAAGVCSEDLSEDIDADTHLTERVMTGLRLGDGLDLLALQRDLGADRVLALTGRARRAIARGLPLQLDAQRLGVADRDLHQLDRLILALV